MLRTDLEIVANTSCTDGVKELLEQVPKYSREIDNAFLGVDLEPNGNVTYLTCNDKSSLLVYKRMKVNRTPFIKIVHAQSDDQTITTTLISKVLTDEPTISILVDPIDNGQQHIISAYKNLGFKISGALYGTDLTRLQLRGSGCSKFEGIRYRKSNVKEYQQLLTKLITEYDTRMNSMLNATYGRPICDKRLNTNGPYRVKVNYFVKHMAFNVNWHTYLLFLGKEPIGFVRGKVDRHKKVCHPEVYLRPAYFNLYIDDAYALILKSLYSAYVRYVGLTSLIADHSLDGLIGHFGRPVAVNLFKIQ